MLKVREWAADPAVRRSQLHKFDGVPLSRPAAMSHDLAFCHASPGCSSCHLSPRAGCCALPQARHRRVLLGLLGLCAVLYAIPCALPPTHRPTPSTPSPPTSWSGRCGPGMPRWVGASRWLTGDINCLQGQQHHPHQQLLQPMGAGPPAPLRGAPAPQQEIIPTCRELGIGIVAYSPLGRYMTCWGWGCGGGYLLPEVVHRPARRCCLVPTVPHHHTYYHPPPHSH